MAYGKLLQAVREAVEDGRLIARFRAKDVKRACPGFADSTYANFLSKHRRGNPGGYSEHFEQIRRGLYRLL